MKVIGLLAICACSKADKPVQLSTVADISGEVTLVAGTRRFAVSGGATWWQSDVGDQPAIGAAIAKERERLGGIVDVFLGTTPIVAGGEEHREELARVGAAVTPIDFDGFPLKVVTLRDREAWLAHAGIFDKLVYVTGTTVDSAPKLELVGPPADTISPVSSRLCATPKVEDIAAFGDEAYALVSECNTEARLRIVAYPSGRVTMLGTREGLAMSFVKLAVSPDGKLHLVGIRNGHLTVANLIEDMQMKESWMVTNVAATRVETALYADDGALWTLVLDGDNKPQVLRNSTVVATPSPPTSLALDDKLGVVVLTDKALLAERPGARIVIGHASQILSMDMSEALSESLRRSVVKLFVVLKEPDYYRPWELAHQQTSGGSACIVEGNRILTNAHVVANQLLVQALKLGDTKKYSARILHVDHDTETALLTVDDPKFFEGTVPVTFGELPPRHAKVSVYGFPVGGSELCITAGVVSRIEVRTYTHSQRNLLALQTDAAINPGNSGGPVFMDGELVGIAFQSYKRKDLEKSGYVVPIPVIRHMFDDLADGKITGVPDLGLYWQKVESDSLREFLGLRTDQTGVRVSRVVHGSSAHTQIEVDDVITHVAGTAVACDGSILLRGEHDRVSFEHLVSERQVGDSLDITVMRRGEEHTLKLSLSPYRSLVPPPRPDRRPTYLIFAGLLFTPLSYEYIHEWDWAEKHHRYRYHAFESFPSERRKQIVLIPQILVHDVNLGYHQMREAVVERINGVEITEMRDVVRALEHPQGKFHVIETDDHGPRSESRRSDYHSAHGTRIVIDASRAKQATAEILAQHGIPSDRSADLR